MQKRSDILILILLITMVITACQIRATTMPFQTPTPTLTTPVSIQQEKEDVLQEIHRIVEQYNAFLENEKSTGNYTIVQLGDGSEGLQFTNESIGKVSAEMERVVGLIVELTIPSPKLN